MHDRVIDSRTDRVQCLTYPSHGRGIAWSVTHCRFDDVKSYTCVFTVITLPWKAGFS